MWNIIKKIFKYNKKNNDDIKFEQEILYNLINNILKYLDDYNANSEEKTLMIAQAHIVLDICKEKSDLYDIASQILSALEDGKLSDKECMDLKSKAYSKMLDYDFDKIKN